MGMRDWVVAAISQILRSMIILWLLLGAACGGQGTNAPGTDLFEPPDEKTERPKDQPPVFKAGDTQEPVELTASQRRSTMHARI